MAERKKPKRPEPTKEIRERASRKLSTGTFREIVRKDLGIGPGTWASWLRDGRAEVQALDEGTIEALGPRGLFLVAIEKSEAQAHEKILNEGVIGQGPEAQRWFLQKRYPHLYSGQAARGIMDDEAGELVKVDPRVLLKEKLAELLAGLSDE